MGVCVGLQIFERIADICDWQTRKALVWNSYIRGQIEIGSFYSLHSITYKSHIVNLYNLLYFILIINSIKTDQIVGHAVIFPGFTNTNPLADFVEPGINRI